MSCAKCIARNSKNSLYLSTSFLMRGFVVVRTVHEKRVWVRAHKWSDSAGNNLAVLSDPWHVLAQTCSVHAPCRKTSKNMTAG